MYINAENRFCFRTNCKRWLAEGQAEVSMPVTYFAHYVDKEIYVQQIILALSVKNYLNILMESLKLKPT